MARPKKPEEEKQKHVAAFRLTDSEYKAFQELSDTTGLSKARLAKYAAIGMKQVYITDELVAEARSITRQCAQIGNLLRLHATLLEVIDQNPTLSPEDRQEITKIRELLNVCTVGVKDLKKESVDLRADIKELAHGNL